MKAIPEWAALPIAAAFLIEFPFYLAPGFESVRNGLAALGRIRAAVLMAISAIAPWLVLSLGTGTAHLESFLLLLGVAAAVSFWYIALGPAPAWDVLFLGLLAVIVLSRIFDRIYISPIPSLSLSVLGHLMLIRTAALAILMLRGKVKVQFQFLPRRGEWLTGFRYFAWMLPLLALAYWALGLVNVRPHPLNILLAVATFFGILWVVALSEEFFFRGLLQQWIEQWTGSPMAALFGASALFGAAHLGFHHQFPNWRWAIIASILGFFCGLAWRRSHSIQASMVTHALTVTLWRTFLQ